MATYTKTKTGGYNPDLLQSQVNSDETIVASCTAISTEGTSLTFTFAAALSAPEETRLDEIIAAHVKPAEVIDVSSLPKSTIDGNKLAVHTSAKPEIEGINTYAIWSGSGDDLNDLAGGNGQGPLTQIQTEIGVPESYVDIEFNPAYGRVWIHEAYIKFTGGGTGDYMSSVIYAYGVPLQQAVGLDLVVVDNYITYSALGPGTGTHGFADPNKISLIPRTFSKDGDWDYDAINGLAPNFTGTGLYKMSDIDQPVHRFINKVPCYGNCASYITMSSDETSEMMSGYFARMTAHNVSNTEWHISAIMELYREVTYSQ